MSVMSESVLKRQFREEMRKFEYFAKREDAVPQWRGDLDDLATWKIHRRGRHVCSKCIEISLAFVRSTNLGPVCPMCIAQALASKPLEAETERSAEALLLDPQCGPTLQLRALQKVLLYGASKNLVIAILRLLDCPGTHPLVGPIRRQAGVLLAAILRDQVCRGELLEMAADPMRPGLCQAVLHQLVADKNKSYPDLPALVRLGLTSPVEAVCAKAKVVLGWCRQQGLEIPLVQAVAGGAKVDLRPWLQQTFTEEALRAVVRWLVTLELVPPIESMTLLKWHLADLSTVVARALTEPGALDRVTATWLAEPSTQVVITRILWLNRKLLLDDLQQEFGEKLLPDSGRQQAIGWRMPMNATDVIRKLPDEWRLLVPIRDVANLYRDSLVAELADELKPLFRAHVPPPPFAEWRPLTEPPKTRWQIMADQTLAQLWAAYEAERNDSFLSSNHGVVTTDSAVRVFAEIRGWQEWQLPNTEPWRAWRGHRAQALAQVVYDHGVQSKIDSPTALVRSLYQRCLGKGSVAPLTPNQLLPANTTRAEVLLPGTREKLAQLLATMPAGHWLRLDNVLTYAAVHGTEPVAADVPAYSTSGTVLSSLQRQKFRDSLVIRPFVQAVAFYLNLLGMMDLAYDAPDSRTAAELARLPRLPLNDSKPPDVSPYSGIQAVRLTALGLEVLERPVDAVDGQAGAPALPEPMPPPGWLEADPRRLLLTLHGINPMLEVQLRSMTDVVKPGLYRLSSAKLLKSCRNQNDVLKRVNALRHLVPKALPTLWEDHLTRLLARAEPLRADDCTVYTLTPGSELAVAIAQNPALSGLVRRAEGGRILVDSDDHAAFCNELLALGFIPPAG